MTQQIFDVDGLRCEGCVSTVREALLGLTGVSSVDITLETVTPSVVRVEADDDLDLELVQRSLAAQGDFQIRR